MFIRDWQQLFKSSAGGAEGRPQMKIAMTNSMKRCGFGQQVREVATALRQGGKGFTIVQLVERMGMAQCEPRRILHTTLSDLRKGGELELTGKGKLSPRTRHACATLQGIAVARRGCCHFANLSASCL
jgi:hypothetical protein